MIDMDEGKFDHVLTDYIQQYGFDEFMIKVVYPFLERIGVLWMTNVIIPAQEHFITNLVRQKIIAAIDELGPAKNGQGKTCIAFLNESEMHELGLLYYSYQLRKNGFKVIYLGQMVPFEDVVSAMEAHEPEYVLTSFVNQTKSGWVDSYLENLLKQNATVEVLASGIQMASVTLENNRVHKFSHVNELISFVKGV
jgi:methanogenic corrinoid protein MtbC1